MKPLFILGIILGLPFMLFGQAPVIQNVEPLNAAPNDTIVITGSGFSNIAADLDVWFGPVKGTVIASSEFAIEVRVPPQATVRVVEVVNRTTRLSVKAPLAFVPSLQTEGFNVANFEASATFSAPEEVWDLCTCDLNTDGKPDIAATKFSSPNSSFTNSTDIMLLQNNSTPGDLTTASFQKFDRTNMPVLNLTFGTDHVVCGDLQGDGYPELIVSRAGSTRNSIHVFRNTTAGTTLSFTLLTTPLLLDVGHFATRLVLRDLNRDGKPEIIVTNSFNDVFYVFINKSSGGTLSFNTTPLKLSIKTEATDVLTTYEANVTDLNADGLPEIVINQFQTNDLYILRNQSTGTISFAPPQKIDIPGGHNRLTSADFNNDGKSDLVVTSTLNDQLDILLNQTADGATSFTFAPVISMETSTGPWGVDVVDIDGDGDTDIAVANRNETAINLFLHNGNFASPGFARSDITTTLPTRNIKAGDLDGDGKPDIAYTAFDNVANTAMVGILRNTNCHKPAILNTQPLVICNGQTIQLTTAPADNVTFAWTQDGAPVGDDNPYLNITTPGDYQVTATGEGGTCSVASDIVSVGVDAANVPADPSIDADTPLCLGSSLTLQTDPGADAYIWTGPNEFTSASEDPSIPVITADHAGIYSLQIQVGECKSDVVTKRIDVAQLADFAITSNNPTNIVCDGGSVTLTVNTQSGHTYQWRKDGVDLASEITTTLSASQEGTYTVMVTNTALGCQTETSGITLTVMQPPVAAYTAAVSACTDEEITFTNESQVDSRATVVHSWNFGDGVNSPDESPSHTYTTAETVNASLTVSYQGVSGCSDTESKSITVVNGVQPSITASAASTCPDEPVTLTIADTFTSVLWSNDATESSIAVLPGTYTVNTVDANGCAGQAEVIIGAKEIPELTASADPATISAGNTSQLTASGAATYAWLPAETLDDPASASPIASPVETTTYRVIGASADGCEAFVDVIVTVAGVALFPPAFSPNGDGQNDIWNVRAESNPDCILNIFDGRGRRIFEDSGENWDGTYQGNAVPEGTYYYVFGCPGKEPVTGSVLVFR